MYQNWHWDVTVYHCAGCWDCTLLPYVIHSLQGYLGELVRSLGTDIMLDDILTTLDEQYNNVRALDALNQELFQLRMDKKESVRLGACLSRHLQSPNSLISWQISARPSGWTKARITSMEDWLNSWKQWCLPQSYLWWKDLFTLHSCSTRSWKGRDNGTIS